MNKGEIILYKTSDGTTALDVRLEQDSIWINRHQMAELFDRDIKTIGKHINNALKEELQNIPVVAKFATTASDSKIYQVEHYNIEMITSVGYRVKSQRGTQFRIWANQILKEYLIKGYAVKENIKLEQYRYGNKGSFGSSAGKQSRATNGYEKEVFILNSGLILV